MPRRYWLPSNTCSFRRRFKRERKHWKQRIRRLKRCLTLSAKELLNLVGCIVRLDTGKKGGQWSCRRAAQSEPSYGGKSQDSEVAWIDFHLKPNVNLEDGNNRVKPPETEFFPIHPAYRRGSQDITKVSGGKCKWRHKRAIRVSVHRQF